ncbi:mo-co oxidoreductase dimerization domain protein [Teladorsagia circumcincta]|uniref:Sulfite oxidase n=1 Tax=Teladorsagia circumcincta TaxID=45464 RepID=A0A2G9TXE8_TELCI|nr:mo-co oxidoreductase dimerization domain protein [Teladorsagia circumcincta]
MFPPNVGLNDPLNWESLPALQDYPVQSAFCIPAQGTKVKRDAETVDVAGYAWSGGGRGIVRVEVSADGGRTWQSAELEQDPKQDLDHMWAWTLFRASIKIPDGVNKMELVVKATDRAHNTQPETAAGIWNVRGLLHNAWHRVEVEIVD